MDINSYNRVYLVGHVITDVKIDTGKDGKRERAVFTLATHESFAKGKPHHNEIHSIIAWGKRAEHCANFLTVGKLIHIEGKLRTSRYEDKEGKHSKVTRIQLETLTLLGKKGDFEKYESKERKKG